MKKIYLLFLPLLHFSGSVLGQTTDLNAPSSLPSNQTMDKEITTASKSTEKISEAPATVYVISKDEIRQRGYIYLKDALRDLPGMETIENYFTEKGTLVPVRGAVGNNTIIVLLNGVRINPPGGEEMMFRSDINILQAKQIEIMYGPGSTLYGQDAINAVINIITESPANAPLVDVTLRAGMYNNKEIIASFAKKIDLGNERFVGITSFLSMKRAQLPQFDQTWWDNNYGDIIRKTGINKEAHRPDNGTNAFLKIENENSSLQVWHRESSRSSSEGGYTPVLQFVKEAIWHDRSTLVQMQNQTKFSDRVSLESSLSFNRYEIDPETRYVFPANETSLFYNDFKYGIGTGLQLEEKFNIRVNSNVSFTAGLMAAHRDIIPKATIPGGVNTNLDITSQGGTLSYFLQAGNPNSRVDVARSYNIIYNNYSAYAEGSYRLSDKWKAVTGFRIDKDTRVSELPLSPRLSLIHNLTPHLTAKYIYNQGFVAPAPYYVYNVFASSAGISIGNPDLLPERATSNEVNLNYAKDNLWLGGSIYLNTQSNLVLPSDQYLPVNVVHQTVYLDLAGQQTTGVYRVANGGKAKAMGFDLFSKYKVGGTSLWGSVSYVNYEQEISENLTGLDGISALNIRLGATWQILQNLTATTSVIARSTPEIANPAGLEKELKNPYAINLHVNYAPTRSWDIFLNATNITNNNYALKGILIPVPQDPIMVNLGLRFALSDN
jgi:outer membrane receptor for ferrienterochelin and colicin